MPNVELSAQERATTAKDELFQSLSTKLVTAMSSGGPVSAIEVCSKEAPKLAQEISARHGLTIGRTSFRLRNPQNAAPEWTQPFVANRDTDVQFVPLKNGATGAMFPIHLKPQCLTCHGPEEQIGDDVKQQLATYYPDDQATGFQDGDLRGWFWVEVPAKSNKE